MLSRVARIAIDQTLARRLHALRERVAAAEEYFAGLVGAAIDAHTDDERRSHLVELQRRLAQAGRHFDRLLLGAYRVALQASDRIPCPVCGAPVQLLVPIPTPMGPMSHGMEYVHPDGQRCREPDTGGSRRAPPRAPRA